MINRIDKKFQEDKKLLSIYFSAGHPSLEDTVPILKKLQAAKVDMVEIGLPFSDPLADGPTIQKSSTQALSNGMTTDNLFSQLENIREYINIPLVLMGYFNPMMQFGIEKFCKCCESIGIDGLIIVDLPIEHNEELSLPAKEMGIDFINFITPTTSPERLKNILKVSSGFLYYVSIAGITGTKAPDIKKLKKKNQLPCFALGVFVVKKPLSI